MGYDKMGRYLLLLLFLQSAQAISTESCRIETAEKIYYIKREEPPNFFQQSNCPTPINKEFNLFIQSSKGTMRAHDVKRILEEKFHSSVSITPSRIEAHSLASLIRSSLSLSQDWKIKEMALLKDTPLLFGDQSTMTMNCANCNYPGKKQIKIDIRGGKYPKVRWATLTLAVKVKALVAQTLLMPHRRPLSQKEFSLEDTYLTNPEGIFQGPEHLHFYRANKKIFQGEALRVSHLSPLKLVSPGDPIDVSYEYQNLSLKTRARPLRFGHYGQRIQLKRAPGQHIIVAKVIDYNKAIVEQ